MAFCVRILCTRFFLELIGNMFKSSEGIPNILCFSSPWCLSEDLQCGPVPGKWSPDCLANMLGEREEDFLCGDVQLRECPSQVGRA